MKHQPRTTETESLHQDLEQKSVYDLLIGINQEDLKVARAVQHAIPQIQALIEAIVPKMKIGGRLFYIGAGTSGRLGVVDASECPPTFGVDFNTVVGLIAGGDGAIRKAVEFAEDDPKQAWQDLQAYQINENDTVIGIAASGSTPYVIGGLQLCNQHQINTGAITCNAGSQLAQTANFPIEVIVGPEFITGSTRMKAGTAQKMVLNMISTSVMIQLGHVVGNRMVDMQLSNDKLVERGTQMVMKSTNLSFEAAQELLLQKGSVRNAIQAFQNR